MNNGVKMSREVVGSVLVPLCSDIITPPPRGRARYNIYLFLTVLEAVKSKFRGLPDSASGENALPVSVFWLGPHVAEGVRERCGVFL